MKSGIRIERSERRLFLPSYLQPREALNDIWVARFRWHCAKRIHCNMKRGLHRIRISQFALQIRSKWQSGSFVQSTAIPFNDNVNLSANKIINSTHGQTMFNMCWCWCSMCEFDDDKLLGNFLLVYFPSSLLNERKMHQHRIDFGNGQINEM